MRQYLAQGASQGPSRTRTRWLRNFAAAGDAGLPLSGRPGYDKARRAPRAMRVQRTARTWGEIWHVDGVAKLLRDGAASSDRDVADHKAHVEWLYGDDALEPGQ